MVDDSDQDNLVRLCKSADVVAGEPLGVDAEGFPPLAVYVCDDVFFVTDNICTHGMAFLSDGCQNGFEIECPFHGGAFDIRSGEAIVFPCSEPIKSYPVTLCDGHICISADPVEVAQSDV